MPRTHKTKVAYEVRVGGRWEPVPNGSRIKPLLSGAALLMSGAGHQTYFDKSQWRIVTVAQEVEIE